MSEQTLHQMLVKIGNGLHKCKGPYWFLNWLPFLGWVEIDIKEGTADAFWCNMKSEHVPGMTMPAFSVEVAPDDEIKWVFRSALSMWPVDNKSHQRFYYNEMVKRIKRIYMASRKEPNDTRKEANRIM